MFAHIIQHLLDGPVLMHGDEIRRHQTSNAVFRVTEQRRGDASLLRCKQPNQLPRSCAWQFFQERRAIVRRHLVQNRPDLLVGHGAQQFLLRVDIEIFKDIRRQCMRQDAKDNHLFVFWQIQNHFGDIGGWPFAKHLTQRREITGVDHAPDLGF